jgi:hypothetical protein
MAYYPGHSCLVKYKAGSGPGSIVTEQLTDTAATLNTAPTTSVLVGYYNDASVNEQFGNSLGNAHGAYNAAYQKPGMPQPQLTFTLFPTASALTFLARCFRSSGALLYTDLFFGLNGAASKIIRAAKCNSGSISVTMGEGQEVNINVTFTGIAIQTGGETMTVTNSNTSALGTPLFAHNVQSLTITDSASADYDARPFLQSFQYAWEHGIRPAGMRADWGDEEPLSRTAYDLQETVSTYTGSLTLLNEPPAALTRAANTSQSWGNIVTKIADTGAGGTNILDLTHTGTMPQRVERSGAAADQLQTWNVPIVSAEMTAAFTRA